MFHYLAVDWIHSFSDEPVCTFHEISEDRVEIRKVYKFRDGHLEAADAHHETDSIGMSWEPIPSNDEIASDPQFVIKDITREGFEEIWKVATQDWDNNE